MWQIRAQDLSASTLRAQIHAGDTVASIRDVLDLWSRSEEFLACWTSALAELPFQGFCWETPPLTFGVMDRPFECVFVESAALVSMESDPGPFTEYFDEGTATLAVRFESLRRDAVLVAPRPRDAAVQYAHLGAFVRTADRAATTCLWRLVASAVNARLGDRPIWLSTAGLGVSWLHVRVDSRPKYYRYRPYTDVAFWNIRN